MSSSSPVPRPAFSVKIEIYYTTKAGRTYKNGLLGFNCRHELRPYEGQLLPTISAEERKAEYAVTLRQRAMERAVRRKRVEALMLKDINKTWYLEARKKAAALYANYIWPKGRRHPL